LPGLLLTSGEASDARFIAHSHMVKPSRISPPDILWTHKTRHTGEREGVGGGREGRWREGAGGRERGGG
jgi:hypothetical protein